MSAALTITKDCELNQPRITASGIMISTEDTGIHVDVDSGGLTLENFSIIMTSKRRMKLINWILNFRWKFWRKYR
jgi:hypothetical protein